MTPDQPNFDADTIKEAMDYFIQRIPEVHAHGWKWIVSLSIGAAETGKHWGVLAEFRNENYEYRYAIYVLKSHRGQGHLPSFIARDPSMKFITIDDCNVAGFYRKHGRDVLVLPSKK